MSGIAVIFRRDGAPVPAADIEAMTTAMAHRAPSGVHHRVDGAVAVGSCTDDDQLAPVRIRGGSTVVAMDGRLDDRRTLAARLGRPVAAGTSDAELLGQAVERWGAGFASHLVGDFAVVVADGADRRVVCARDHLGVKPLYYAEVGPFFVAASEVRAVLAHPAVPHDLDPAALAAWAEAWVVPGGTIYRHVRSLAMGSVLVATASGVGSPSRFWHPPCEPDCSARPAALVEEYRWRLREAVRDRLRSTGPVVVAMSGGLDSTSVAAEAANLSRQEPGLPAVQPASLVFPGHPRIDESPLIDSMEEALGLPVRRVRPRPRTPDELAAEIDRYRELPDVPNDQVPQLVRPELGERVVLTGLGGDDWFFSSPGLDITRAVRHGRIGRAVAAARRERAEARSATVGEALWRHGLRPLPKVPGAVIARSPLLSALVTAAGGRHGSRLVSASWCPRGVPLDTAPLLSWTRNPLLGSRLAVIERRAAHCGFEYRHPLHDVRLVELSLRLPGDLRIVDGDARWLPRRVMEGVLPDDVRLRWDKAEFSLAVREELDVAGAAGVLGRAIARCPDPGPARRDWQAIEAIEPDAWHPRLAGLWSTLALGLWQERADGRSE